MKQHTYRVQIVVPDTADVNAIKADLANIVIEKFKDISLEIDVDHVSTVDDEEE